MKISITSPLALLSRLWAWLLTKVVFSKTLIFIGGLILSHSLVDCLVVSLLINYFVELHHDSVTLREAAVYVNLQDALSSLLVTVTTHVSESIGRFTVIQLCTLAQFMGLLLLWLLNKFFNRCETIFYVAMPLLALGEAGCPALRDFLEYQLKEKVKRREEIIKNPGNQSRQCDEKEDEQNDVAVNIWWRCAWFPGIVVSNINWIIVIDRWNRAILIAGLSIGGAYLLFLSGYFFYSFEKPAGSPLVKVYRVVKAALWKSKFEYPDSEKRYYWKNHRENHLHTNSAGRVQLSPKVPVGYRWLDKAAIIRDPSNLSPERQEMNGELFSVKEVREVKRFASLIHLSFTLLPYSLVLAAGDTFFFLQTSNLIPNFPITILTLLRGSLRRMVKLLMWWLNLKRQGITVVRIGSGMFCGFLCCFVAWQVESHRLSLVRNEGIGKSDMDTNISMSIGVLAPQFILLGLMEALADDGLENLFRNHVPKSMWSMEEPFSEFVFGIGKLLTIPCLYIFTDWFKAYINNSHLERYYLMLGILNCVSLCIYAYYSKNYIYDEEYPLDEEIKTTDMEMVQMDNVSSSRP